MDGPLWQFLKVTKFLNLFYSELITLALKQKNTPGLTFFSKQIMPCFKRVEASKTRISLGELTGTSNESSKNPKLALNLDDQGNYN